MGIVSDERFFLIGLQTLFKTSKNPEKIGTLLGCGVILLNIVMTKSQPGTLSGLQSM